MKKEAFERYFRDKIPIEFWIKNNTIHSFKGIIIYLGKTSFVFKEKKDGEITMDYSDVLPPIKKYKEVD